MLPFLNKRMSHNYFFAMILAICMPFLRAIQYADDEEGGGGTDAEVELATTIKQQITSEVALAVKDAMSDFMKDVIKADDFSTRLKALGIEENTIKDMLSTMEEQGLRMKKIVEDGGSQKGFTELFTKSFEDKQKRINQISNDGAGSVELLKLQSPKDFAVTKAVGDITTANVSTSGTFSALHELINADDIRPTNLRDPWIDQWATVTRTSKATYSYAEYEPKEGDADFVGEGGTKPQIDIKVTTRSITPNKCAAHIVLTEEARDDVPQMESQSRVVLAKKVALKRQDGILFGDGAGDNPTGVTTVAQAYNPATWDANQKVSDPNLKDVIIAIANQIYTTHNYVDEDNYVPNLAVMNPADYHAWLTRKDANNQYLFLNLQLGGTTAINGISVIHHRDIPSGYILMGDFTKLNIINYIDYTVRVGWINDQLVKNQFTIVGETRFFTYVRNLDQVAFVYDEIANVVNGIEEVIA